MIYRRWFLKKRSPLESIAPPDPEVEEGACVRVCVTECVWVEVGWWWRAVKIPRGAGARYRPCSSIVQPPASVRWSLVSHYRDSQNQEVYAAHPLTSITKNLELVAASLPCHLRTLSIKDSLTSLPGKIFVVNSALSFIYCLSRAEGQKESRGRTAGCLQPGC